MRKARPMKLPPRGKKCERQIAPKGQFHDASFRWAHSGPVHVLIACPKRARVGGRLVKTDWVPSAGAYRQCRVAGTKAKVAMSPHKVVTARHGKTCRRSYKKV